MSLAIKLVNVTRSYGSNLALRGVSLELEAGNFYILLGKNGAGKSTLMRLLMRYEMPDTGSGTVLGQPIDSESDAFNLEIGYVSESLDYHLPLRMNKLFSYFAEIYPRWDRAIFEGMLRELRIDLNKHFRELSRGQKMQVAFAAAAAIQPKLLILDEITAVLDANARAFFMDYLGRFTRQGGTVVMATNIVSEVQNYANHMILMHDGLVSLDVPVRDLSKLFLKIRRAQNEPHPIFNTTDCVEVALNSDGSTSHIVSRELSQKFEVPERLHDYRGITAEEIFIYFTRGGFHDQHHFLGEVDVA
ncbi:MAG: ABC transporter ATP-binding protein [Deltaproteobacteria bacterium]|nr:ABC transporter ATP-binding protein [Deltaproteobacteria bacterium]